jgi:cbb3-type cytochrome oxidase cytochrome c subunit
VRECFLHCGKALIRAHLWDPTARVERGVLPSLGQMLKDQARLEDTAEQIEQSLQEGYKTRLY